MRSKSLMMSGVSRWCLSVAGVGVALGFGSATQAATVEVRPGVFFDLEYTAGDLSASETSYLIVDFAATGGDAFAFGYQHDGTKTGLDLVTDVAAAGALDLFTTAFSFGIAVDGFAFGSQSVDLPFPQPDGRFWEYFLSGGSQDTSFDGIFDPGEELPQTGGWTSAGVGVSGRLLDDGSIDGWVVNAFGGDPSQALEPPAIPEPATAAGLLMASVVMLRRRRG